MMSKTLPYQDVNLPMDQRARDLLGRLTLEEKCAQLTYAAPGVERLGMQPHNWWNECLHGVGRAGLATVFPQAIGLAATFDVELMHRIAVAISDEGRAKHHAHASRGDFGIYKGLSYWTPNINIFRDPRWGRGHETYGECPYLTARMGVAFCKGLQGDDPTYLKAIATPKHFAVHSGPEKGRHEFDAQATPQDLHATYLPAFKACITEAGAFSVMGAYNRLNGVPCCANSFLLERTLRHDWGFQGYTVSDCGALADLHLNHKVTANVAESAAMALKNGLDMCCGSDYEHLRAALEKNLLDEETVDRATYRLLLARMKLGMFDPPERVPYTRIAYSVVDSPEHAALSLRAARQSIMLLRNQGNLLPVQKQKLKSVAVIGPNADAPAVLLANYMGTPSHIITPLEGIRAALGPNVRVQYIAGTTHLATDNAWTGTATRGFVEAEIAAAEADLVVLCLGLSPTIEGEEGDAMNSDAGGDRSAIELPAIQQQLIQRVMAVGKPVVLVLIGGSAMAIPWASENVPAIIQQFYPGQDGGTALADVLFGEHNPSGRLPVTVYRATSDLPAFGDYAMTGRTYRYFQGEALYPFGFGLSYTRFEYSDIKVSSASPAVTEDVQVSVSVRNAGSRAGDEIVQLYLEHHDAPFRVPLRQLAALARVNLPAGASQRVQFTLKPADLAAINEAGKPVQLGGEVAITIAGSQGDPRSIALGAATPARAVIRRRC